MVSNWCLKFVLLSFHVHSNEPFLLLAHADHHFLFETAFSIARFGVDLLFLGPFQLFQRFPPVAKVHFKCLGRGKSWGRGILLLEASRMVQLLLTGGHGLNTDLLNGLRFTSRRPSSASSASTALHTTARGAKVRKKQPLLTSWIARAALFFRSNSMMPLVIYILIFHYQISTFEKRSTKFVD